MRKHSFFFIILAEIIVLTNICQTARAQRLHTAPIVVTGKEILSVARYPISTYRLFRVMPSGAAEAIPFQMDEINDDGDYVLDQGKDITSKTGNGIFDAQDELTFMGDDVGAVNQPTSWPQGKPNVLYELKITHPVSNPMGPSMGAVYIGIYFSNAPQISPRKYVVFSRDTALVHTSKYKYQFDNQNWLVAKKVEVAKDGTNPVVYEPMLDSTTFYMKGDLKYFITVEANHRSIESELEAWRSGPIRSLVRVSFYYRLLKLKIELGMYTEISFFSNAVYLPAIMYNPIDGRKSLNAGSGMYYGLALRDNPNLYNIETNMVRHEIVASNALLASGRSFYNRLVGGDKPDSQASQGLYWISAQGGGKSIYMEITPGADLQKEGVAPTLYREDVSALDMKGRDNNTVLPLGRSPVNLGIVFDATNFSEGEHTMGFRLFFENVVAPERLAVFKGLKDWHYSVSRLTIPAKGVLP